MNDDDIPVLTDAVRRSAPAGFSRQQVDDVCDALSAEAWVLIDRIVAEALREVEDDLRVRINERLADELPQLIANSLREKLGDSTND